MYIEKREIGKSIKYYLVYSYREKNKVKFVRVFKEYDELIGNSSDIDRSK